MREFKGETKIADEIRDGMNILQMSSSFLVGSWGKTVVASLISFSINTDDLCFV